MAKIRLQGVSIKSIEIDGIEDPTVLLKGVEISEPVKQEPAKIEVVTPEVVEEVVAKEEKVEEAPPVEEPPRENPQSLAPAAVESLNKATRLRDVIDAFVRSGVEDKAMIVESCKKLKSQGHPLLKRLADIDGRIPVAYDNYMANR